MNTSKASVQGLLNALLYHVSESYAGTGFNGEIYHYRFNEQAVEAVKNWFLVESSFDLFVVERNARPVAGFSSKEKAEQFIKTRSEWDKGAKYSICNLGFDTL